MGLSIHKLKNMKKFKKKAEDIIKLVDMPQRCMATDKITCEGCKVGYMYRETPDDEMDSGWRFFAGTEDQDYVDNPENLEWYHPNTIANYDPSIISFLNAPYGSAFEWDDNEKTFIKIDFPEILE